MENNPDEYEPGIDQNQGVAGTMARNQQQDDTGAEGTLVPGLDPNLVTNQAEKEPENGGETTGTGPIGAHSFVKDEGLD